ncbi:hypothetical protein HDU91_003725 [Kappamyces sp. JEL0680]|nr:hypothetical protein HDU91_003725 [Kappamyces sp. JEL0680]
MIIVNGPKCTPCQNHKDLSSRSNVQVMYRVNKGFDFGGYHFVLSQLADHGFEDYSYYIFLNSGVRGPLLPAYSLDMLHDWPRLFTSRLNDKVKLVGPSISCQLQVHVQSHFFALDTTSLRLVWRKGLFSPASDSIKDLVVSSELELTNTVMEAGWTIDSLLLPYAATDWRAVWSGPERGRNQCNSGGNPLKEKEFGSLDRATGKPYSLDPFQTVFYKRGGSLRYDCYKYRPGPGLLGEDQLCDTDAAVEDLSTWLMNWVEQNGTSMIM